MKPRRRFFKVRAVITAAFGLERLRVSFVAPGRILERKAKRMTQKQALYRVFNRCECLSQSEMSRACNWKVLRLGQRTAE